VISIRDYFGRFATEGEWCVGAAQAMLDKVNALLLEAEAHGVELPTNPKTGSLVSGEQYGGFRPQSCPQGAPRSSHKEGRAVDVYDPHGALDRWLTDARLESHGLYREAPSATQGWCHLTDKAPGSGRRTFLP